MKKIIVTISILMVIGLLHHFESTYYRQVTVIDNQENKVVCVDKSGNIWEYEGQAANIGDKITLIMNDNHTSKITDDIIKGIKQ